MGGWVLALSIFALLLAFIKELTKPPDGGRRRWNTTIGVAFILLVINASSEIIKRDSEVRRAETAKRDNDKLRSEIRDLNKEASNAFDNLSRLVEKLPAKTSVQLANEASQIRAKLVEMGQALESSDKDPKMLSGMQDSISDLRNKITLLTLTVERMVTRENPEGSVPAPAKHSSVETALMRNQGQDGYTSGSGSILDSHGSQWNAKQPVPDHAVSTSPVLNVTSHRSDIGAGTDRGNGVSRAALQDWDNSDPINARDAYWSAKDLVSIRPPGPPPKRSHKLAERVSLGVRCSVLRFKRSDDSFEEVPLTMEFHSGEGLRLNLSSDREAYLYVVQQGSRGTWTPLYPRPGLSESNKLLPGSNYQLPSRGTWTFEGDPGQEKLLVLLTLRPETDLDQTIASLRAEDKGGSQTISTQRIDAFSGSRDIIEQGAGAVHGDAGNYAVTQATDPHVVIKVILNHR